MFNLDQSTSIIEKTLIKLVSTNKTWILTKCFEIKKNMSFSTNFFQEFYLLSFRWIFDRAMYHKHNNHNNHLKKI